MTCKPPVTYSDPRSVAELEEPLRSRVAALMADAPTGGLILVSGRRSPYQQWILRNARCPGRECDPSCKGSPLTALPGRSNHQRGHAADLGGRELAWAGRNAARYGLHRPVPGEPWHFEATDTAPTVPIPRWPRAKVDVYPGDSDWDRKAVGLPDNTIAEIQIRLKILASAWKAPDLDPGDIDGRYGPRSQGAVVAFERRIIALQIATRQPTWPTPDPIVEQRTIDMLRYWTP